MYVTVSFRVTIAPFFHIAVLILLAFLVFHNAKVVDSDWYCALFLVSHIEAPREHSRY